jgi:gamma-D-glutamyl-L-lysine dipeptidyl-peptidase
MLNAIRLIFLLTFCCFLLSAQSATIKVPVANMFSQASEDTDVVSQAILGTNVKIVERKSGWARIQTPDEYLGWIPITQLVESTAPYGKASSLKVNSLFSHLYREPSVTKHAPLLTVPFEATLELVRKQDARWAQVRLPDDRAAWIQLGDTGLPSQPLDVAEMITLSKRFLGLPYTWGGTSSFGYDCSGYTQMLCRRRGILMPRDADDQAFWNGMSKVEPKDIQPGDLLYFGKSLDKITHTGLFIGQGEFIHATVSGRPIIQISTLAGEWTKSMVAIRRPK